MKHTNPTIDRMKAVALFADCTQHELEVISANTTPHHANAGDVLVGEGRFGHEFVVIVSGTAAVMIGDEQVATIGPGEFFGEIALLDNGPRSASVVAVTDVEAEVSSHQEFQSIVAGAPSVVRSLLTTMARRLRETNSHLVS